MVFIFTLTTLVNHREAGIIGSAIHTNLNMLQMDMTTSALYSSGVPENIQRKVAEVLGNASTPGEPAAKKLKTEHLPPAFAPRGKAPRGGDIPAAGEAPSKAPRRSGPQGARGRGGRTLL